MDENKYNPENPEENSINPGNPEEESQHQTPPPVERRFEVESEWAEKLGMDFDPRRVTPPPVPGSPQPAEPAAPSHPEAPVAQGPYVYDATRMPPPGQGPTQTPGQTPGQTSGPIPGREPMPPTYMLWAVIATICCCMPAGIVAIIYSSSVSSKYFARDYEGAKRASENAEIWIIASIVLGIVVNALYLPLALMMPQ